MAGMEQIEVHSRNYLLRWVNAKPNHTISWTIQPHKRSINFGLFKHPGALAGLSSVGGLPPLSTTSSRTDENADEQLPEVVEKLAGIGLKQVINLGKCEADKFSQGKYDIPPGEAGNYALVFDNTFSKSISKTVTFFLMTFPTNYQSQISFGAQIHHSQAMASAMSMAPPLTARRSPKLAARGKQSVDSLNQASLTQATLNPTAGPSISEESPSIHTGVLQKRRRKKHQGYARRFFCLDFTSSTLSYYHDRNSSALRGAIPLSLAAIGANAKTREISIDSGAEIWHLKANNAADFESWKAALEKASKLIVENTTPGPSLNIDTHFESTSNVGQEQEWARLETLLGKISGTRDAVRRLCLETLNSPLPPASPQFDGTVSTPTEHGEGYFPAEERRAFWKRKPSSTPTNSSFFKRSVSAQLTIPSPGGSGSIRSGHSTPQYHHHYRREEDMHDHMKALLQNLDQVVREFSSMMMEYKQKRTPDPKSALSRMSLQSVESQEYFDAEDKTLVHSDSHLLDIQDDGDESDGDGKSSADSATSSDIDDSSSVLATGRAFRSGSLSSLLPPKAKSLTPLPMNSVERRSTVKAPTVTPPSLIGFLRKNVGKDLSTISMPVSANEPTSLLQRAAENLEYSDLLDKAAASTDEQERMTYVAAFAISNLSSTRVKERSLRKPFNPMLGETYELVREDLNFRFIAEKVSHRPVQLAFHAESSEWAFTQSPLPSQKFWGKSSEIITEGKARLILHGNSGGECFSWSAPTSFLRNIIAGEKYVEPVGTTTILNETTGWKAVITFKAKGMFSGRSEDVDVQLFDRSGAEMSTGLTGTWTSNLMLKENGRVNSDKQIWKAGPLVDNASKHYGMTIFAASLNEITDMEKDKLPPTDSRLRADQLALENGNHEEAERLKNVIEEGQRKRRREMEAKGEEWTPKFFTKVKNGDEVIWKLKSGKEDGYWERRAKDDWNGVVDVLSTDE